MIVNICKFIYTVTCLFVPQFLIDGNDIKNNFHIINLVVSLSVEYKGSEPLMKRKLN